MPEVTITTTPDIKDLDLGAAYGRARHKHLVPAMEKSVAAVRGAVRDRVPVGATGAARRSIGAQVIVTPSKLVGRVGSSFRRPTVYIFVQNYGRLPGKKPPPFQALVPWVLAKGLAAGEKEARRVSFVIARSIGKKGNRRPPFMQQGLDSVKSQIDAFHQQAVEAIVQEMERDLFG